MDIALLSKMIEDLVLENDSVTLPGLGEFVVRNVPASFSDRGYTIHPPYRTLSFSAHESPENKLAALYSKLSGSTIKDSQAEIEEFCRRLSARLRTEMSVEFPGLGILRKRSGGLTVFIQDEDLDIFPGGTGLESLSLRSRSPRTDMPDSGEGAPAVEKETPAVERETPSAGKEPPAAGKETPAAGKESRATGKPCSPKLKKALVIGAAIIGILAVVCIVVAILGRTCPEILDHILYNDEQLRIITKYGL